MKRMKRFTSKDIEPFLTVTCRPDGPDAGVLVASLGAAVQKADGRWETHDLSDEACGDGSRRVRQAPGMDEYGRGKAVSQMKKRLRDALNRLKEHYERVYVYSVGA
jgi:hypothetical protein